MPALQPVPGVARVTYRGSYAGTTWANILHVARLDAADELETGAWTQTEITALAGLMRVQWNAQWRGLVNTAVTLTSTEAVDLTSDTGVVGSDLTNVVGTLAGSQLTAQVSCCVSWREAYHYRGGHPRTYLPPATTSQIASGTTWTTAYQSAVETAMNSFRIALLTDVAVSADGCQLVAVHRTRNHAQLGLPIVNKITAAVVDNRVDTQRRRLGPDV